MSELPSGASFVPARRAALTLAVTGLAFASGTTLMAAGFAPGALGFALWAAVPYVLLIVLTRAVTNGCALVWGAASVVLAEAYIRAQVFLSPRSSTAALALIFSPLYLSFGALPAGLGAGWLGGRLWRRSGPGRRASMLAVGGIAVLVIAVATIRPGVLPGPVARLVSARERLGPPRVVIGDGVLSKTRLAERPAWYQVMERDGGAIGEVIVAVEGGTMTVLDPRTGAPRRQVPLTDEARRKWNWFSRLVPDGSDLLIAQTGGGYSEVGVLDLAGQLRWAFRPDPTLPPIALLPADLDGDGEPEFYSASLRSVYRLDKTGRVVWQRTVEGLVNSLDVAPGGGQPGLIAAVTSTRRIHVWSAAGDPLATLSLVEKEAYRFTLVDWPRSRSLVGGSERVTVLDLEGRPRLQYPLGDFRFQEARAVRFGEAAGAHLAVLAAGPRELGRWRLLVFAPDGAPVYDEILAGGGRLHVLADGDSAREALLLAGEGLWRYRR
jgi:hypothetical protein